MRKKLLSGLVLLLACVRTFGFDLKVWLSDPVMVADGKTVTYLTFYQTDSEDLYWMFELHAKLPKGIHIAKRIEGRKEVNDAKLNPIRFEGLPHVLGVNMPDATTLNVTCVNSSSKDTYYRDDVDGNIIPELFTIGLIADPEMQNGTYEIEITKAIFLRADVTGNDLYSPAKATMTITGGQGAEGERQYTISDACYGTIILPYDAELPTGLTAYTCPRMEGASVVLEQQESIPANTPVVLYGTPGTYAFSGEGTATEKMYTSGLLTGVYEATEISKGYVLQKHGDVIAFYAVDPGVPRVVPAGHCYLNVASDVSHIGFWNGGDRDGIETVSDIANPKIIVYDLMGRRVERNIKGVIIKNGKKVLQ